MADPMQDATMQQNPDQGGMDMSQGYCIEIKVDASGKCSVGVEPAKEEAMEEGASVSGGEKYQPVGSFKDAIMVAMDIYKNKGQIQSGGDDAAFSEGFKTNQPM